MHPKYDGNGHQRIFWSRFIVIQVNKAVLHTLFTSSLRIDKGVQLNHFWIVPQMTNIYLKVYIFGLLPETQDLFMRSGKRTQYNVFCLRKLYYLDNLRCIKQNIK